MKLHLELSWNVDETPFDRHSMYKVLTDPIFVPRVGDMVELADGWAGQLVHHVFLGHDGKDAYIRLEPYARAISRESSDELLRLVEHGWTMR